MLGWVNAWTDGHRRTDGQTRVYMPLFLSISTFFLSFFLLSFIHPSSIHYFFPPPTSLPSTRKPQTANHITPWTPASRSNHVTSHHIKSNYRHNKEAPQSYIGNHSVYASSKYMYNAESTRHQKIIRVRGLLVGERRVRSCDYVYVDRLIN